MSLEKALDLAQPLDPISILGSSRHRQGRQLIRHGFNPHGAPLHVDRKGSITEFFVTSGDLRDDVESSEPRLQKMVEGRHIVRDRTPRDTCPPISICRFELGPSSLAVFADRPPAERLVRVLPGVEIVQRLPEPLVVGKTDV